MVLKISPPPYVASLVLLSNTTKGGISPDITGILGKIISEVPVQALGRLAFSTADQQGSSHKKVANAFAKVLAQLQLDGIAAGSSAKTLWGTKLFEESNVEAILHLDLLLSSLFELAIIADEKCLPDVAADIDRFITQIDQGRYLFNPTSLNKRQYPEMKSELEEVKRLFDAKEFKKAKLHIKKLIKNIESNEPI